MRVLLSWLLRLVGPALLLWFIVTCDLNLLCRFSGRWPCCHRSLSSSRGDGFRSCGR